MSVLCHNIIDLFLLLWPSLYFFLLCLCICTCSHHAYYVLWNVFSEIKTSYLILSYNVLKYLSKLLGQRKWKVGLGKAFHLSYHINSDSKSQSYGSKCTISSLNVLMCFSKLLGQSWNVGLSESFNLSHMINSDDKSQSCTSKYAISSHNILICLSKLLGQ